MARRIERRAHPALIPYDHYLSFAQLLGHLIVQTDVKPGAIATAIEPNASAAATCAKWIAKLLGGKPVPETATTAIRLRALEGLFGLQSDPELLALWNRLIDESRRGGQRLKPALAPSPPPSTGAADEAPLPNPAELPGTDELPAAEIPAPVRPIEDKPAPPPRRRHGIRIGAISISAAAAVIAAWQWTTPRKQNDTVAAPPTAASKPRPPLNFQAVGLLPRNWDSEPFPVISGKVSATVWPAIEADGGPLEATLLCFRDAAAGNYAAADPLCRKGSEGGESRSTLYLAARAEGMGGEPANGDEAAKQYAKAMEQGGVYALLTVARRRFQEGENNPIVNPLPAAGLADAIKRLDTGTCDAALIDALLVMLNGQADGLLGPRDFAAGDAAADRLSRDDCVTAGKLDAKALANARRSLMTMQLYDRSRRPDWPSTGEVSNRTHVYAMLRYGDEEARAFFSQDGTYSYLASLSGGTAFVAYIPWWADDWKNNIDFEVYFAANCTGYRSRMTALVQLFRMTPAQLSSPAKVRAAASMLADSRTDYDDCMENDEARRSFAEPVIAFAKTIGNKTAGAEIDGLIIRPPSRVVNYVNKHQNGIVKAYDRPLEPPSP